MAVTVVRYTTRPERADENAALVAAVFEELARTDPGGIRYASFRLDDGVTFLHVASIDTDDGSNPLTEVTAFAEFQRGLTDRCAVPPAVGAATLVGSYGLGSPSSEAQVGEGRA